jgi:hypothetical protein
MDEQLAPGAYLEPRDRAHAATLEGGERDAVVSTVARYRREDRLEHGDALPVLELVRLADGSGVRLDSLVTDRPLVLVFGSFT